MKPRSIVLIILLAVVPMLLLVWAGLRITADEQRLVQDRFRGLMENQLRSVNVNIAKFFESTERHLDQLTQMDVVNIDSIRETIRSEPTVLQIFALSQQGELIYPNPTQALNSVEQSFLLSTGKMFTGKDLREAVLLIENQSDNSGVGSVSVSSRSGSPPSPVPQSQATPIQLRSQTSQMPIQSLNSTSTIPRAKGWFTWYWDRGLHLIYWQRRPSGLIVGVALERGRWLADLVAQLPNTESPSIGSSNTDALDRQTKNLRSYPELTMRIRLVSASSEVIYQWGQHEIADKELPLCEIPVANPLQSWRLQCFVPKEQFRVSQQGTLIALLTGLGAVAITVALMAWVLYRDYSASMREAAQQVSFVNQVSHELKTPLTNIRLYAELLERDMVAYPEENAGKPMSRVNVIVSESERLSRLIGNVLTLARQQKRSLKPNPRPLVPDHWIQRTVERYRPSLDERFIALTMELNATNAMQIDPDFLGQILENLISNVEKYAAEGGKLSICSSHLKGCLQISVADAGPGIPRAKWREVFRPFTRLSNSLNSSAGTGIGLSISRELARQHGGDITLVECPQGCHFRVTLCESGIIAT